MLQNFCEPQPWGPVAPQFVDGPASISLSTVAVESACPQDARPSESCCLDQLQVSSILRTDREATGNFILSPGYHIPYTRLCPCPQPIAEMPTIAVEASPGEADVNIIHMVSPQLWRRFCGAQQESTV